VQTLKIVDGKPIANDDSDTLSALASYLEGNVITGVGTDGGIALGSQITGFTPQADGVDNAIDNARVTSIVFEGQTYNLTVDSSGTASGGSYAVSSGTFSWTHASNGSALVFDDNGYYKYTPPTADVPNPVTGPTNRQVLLTATPAAADLTVQGMSTISSVPGSAAVNFDASNGAGVTGTSTLNNLESLVVNFNLSTYQQGVQGLRFQVYRGGSTEALTFTFYHIDGHELGQYTAAGSSGGGNSWIAMPTEFSSVGRVTILADTGTDVRIRTVEFDAVTNSATAPVAPKEIEYTLTDEDGQFSTASLSLNIVSNTFAGDRVTANSNDTISGTAANDAISGGGGNDILSGLGGHDLIQGGAGDDTIDGGADNDVISAGAGNDNVVGGTGDDLIRGNDGSDILAGDAGMDRLEGGAGSDTLSGGADDDILIGGAGADTLSGGLGADVFRWELADVGAKGAPTVDTVTDFSPLAAGAGGDILDLRDLLTSENHDVGTGNLASYLHFEKVGADTVVHVSSNGGFSGGYVLNQENQTLLLQNVDLIGTFTNDQQIIQDLLNKGKLIAD
jgi:Ca2+-binding RTX toxin-like protein